MSLSFHKDLCDTVETHIEELWSGFPTIAPIEFLTMIRLTAALSLCFAIGLFYLPAVHAETSSSRDSVIKSMAAFMQRAEKFGAGEGLSEGTPWPVIEESRNETWAPDAALPANDAEGREDEPSQSAYGYFNLGDQSRSPSNLNSLIQRDYSPKISSKFPKMFVGGEIRTRTFLVRQGMDLGFDSQPRLVYDSDGNRTAEVPPLNIQKFGDNYEMLEERITLPVTLKWNADLEFIVAPRILNRNVRHLKYPDEEQLHGLQIDHGEVRIVELYFNWTRFFWDEWTLRIGRTFLEKQFKIFGVDPEQVNPTDNVQLIYTSNPWQVLLEVQHPQAEELRKAGQPSTSFDVIVIYKNDWLRSTTQFLAPTTRGRLADTEVDQSVVLNVVDNLDVEILMGYAFGKNRIGADGYVNGPRRSAFGNRSGAKYHFKDLPFKPSVSGAFHYYSGGSEIKDFEAAGGGSLYYGYLAEIIPTNVRMLQGGIALDTSKFTKVLIDYWAFEQVRAQSRAVGQALDNGGIQVETTGVAKGLGQEFDLIFQWQLLDNLSTQAYGAWFFPGKAFGNDPVGRPYEGAAWQVNPFEFRWELLYNF